ncbi:BamA/TamA family outer membrane protein [Granulosicoccaceae sp. 1_MG-2023]|nr:BamA/TamA family outer membrane protein [Granulosicoccaceae sp. 1_MG-2023]
MQAAGPTAIDGEELCEGTIDRVYFSGNEVTRESVLRQEMTFAEGDACDPKAIHASRQNFMDLGLFSSVKVSLTRYSDRLVLQYKLREKHFILPIPRISRTSDGELRFGGQLRMDNFAGLNHQLKITSERHVEDDGAGRAGFEHSFQYTVPRFQNSRYGLSVQVSRMDKEFELKQGGVVYGESSRIGDSISLDIRKRRNRGAGSRGWQNSYGVSYEHRGHDLIEGELGPFEEGYNLQFSAGLWRNGVHLQKYRRTGYVYGGRVSVGVDSLGGDYEYQRFDGYYRGYRPIEADLLTNVNYNFELGYTNGRPFGERAYSIGGGESVRGLDSKSVDGDVKLLLNIEFLQAFPRYPALRWVGFWDIANVFPRWDFKPVYTKTGLGLGLRWKVVSFVRVDLRFDYGFSLTEQKGYTYIGTQLNF